jgi:hypothetical protein
MDGERTGLYVLCTVCSAKIRLRTKFQLLVEKRELLSCDVIHDMRIQWNVIVLWNV